ncbi:phosphoenolpyruvate hydrolase family protein [Salinibacter sp.]|uniref:phosphoenolpyruvate hydrolase family protein n=1 Tax=Salinibacter sp. TaxID=2065818 RepID=UPI0021E798D5|nr:phosphoenolpyruvate hydrolase family protein [Salinibacter sp.]
MSSLDRTDVLNRLHASNGPLIGAGVGSGFAAKFAERGGADFVIVHNAGRFRAAGTGSLAGLLPFGDANAITADIAEEVVRAVDDIPVFAGVCGTDPLRSIPAFLEKLATIGVAGIQNFPTVGVIDGAFRQHLDETGLGFEQEVEMIRQADEHGFVTAPYVFNEAQTQAMAEVGADVVVPHMGLTTKGDTGATTALTFDTAADRVQVLHDTAVDTDPSVQVVCHGGPMAEPEDVQAIFDRTDGLDGFFGASSIERLPVEPAIEEQTRRFKKLDPEGTREKTTEPR